MPFLLLKQLRQSTEVWQWLLPLFSMCVWHVFIKLLTYSLTSCSWLPPCCQDRSQTLWQLHALLCRLASRELPSYDNNSVPDLKTACCHHAVMMGQEHCCGRTFYRLDALPVTQLTALKHQRQTTKNSQNIAFYQPTLRILFGSSNVTASGRFIVSILLPGKVPSMSISARVTLSSLNISSNEWKSITYDNSQYFCTPVNHCEYRQLKMTRKFWYTCMTLQSAQL